MAEEFSHYHPFIAEIARSGIRVSFPVVGSSHHGIASAVNWLVARGRPLVVGGMHALPVPYPGDPELVGQNVTYTFTHWVRTDDLHTTVILLLDLSVEGINDSNATCAGIVEFPKGSGNVAAFTAGTSEYPTRIAISAEIPALNVGQSVAFSISTTTYTPPDDFIFLRVHGTHMFEAPL
ncbi:MAG TPA: hypothetical protein VJ724_15275, partial [Tahibacter sp.]|nr:hypothetical protein [Tahibacter sp.]